MQEQKFDGGESVEVKRHGKSSQSSSRYEKLGRKFFPCVGRWKSLGKKTHFWHVNPLCISTKVQGIFCQRNVFFFRRFVRVLVVATLNEEIIQFCREAVHFVKLTMRANASNDGNYLENVTLDSCENPFLPNMIYLSSTRYQISASLEKALTTQWGHTSRILEKCSSQLRFRWKKNSHRCERFETNLTLPSPRKFYNKKRKILGTFSYLLRKAKFLI